MLAWLLAQKPWIGRFGRAALSAGAVVQLAGLAALVTVLVQGWPHVSLWATAGPLALAGAGQSILFVGLFRSVLADVPTHLGGVGSGVLITLQQSGLALGTLYLALAAHNTAHAFATVEYVQMGIVALLAVGAAAPPGRALRGDGLERDGVPDGLLPTRAHGARGGMHRRYYLPRCGCAQQGRGELLVELVE
ncbi:hypothetical protein [Dactylosporangium sp. NPDC049140]|uniref:hypothetical protein n=1 Tax=Dactylosporangium sp. NPDC049140 TaxID=3155647 RepID=UPI0033FC1A2A